MTTQTIQQNNSGLKVLILGTLAIGLAIALAVAVADIPLTKHAEEGRVDGGLGAIEIQAKMENNTCSPIQTYICPKYRQGKVLCHLSGQMGSPNALWGGLIVGMNNLEPTRIISGYVAPRSYWDGTLARDRCHYGSFVH